ncbi:MAG: hypothetical protein GY809_22245 [Planctomycetes bacterium]|nr:hypothetical protein [Planctomycetota bacterium]
MTDKPTMEAFFQCLGQIESQRGIRLSGHTLVKDGQIEKDRVIQMTYLWPHQIEQILQFLQSQGLAVRFDQKLAPMSMQGVIDFGGERIEFDVRGDLLLQPVPPDPDLNVLPY